MKIDLHCHTKQTKVGDPKTRNVDKKTFLEKLSGSSVSIVAITNHNAFDIEQYNDFANNELDILVFPGIELDIVGKESNGHCLLISDPADVDNFNKFVIELLNGVKPDDFKIEIDDFINKIINKDYILIPHYGSKPNSLKQIDIDYLKTNAGNIPILLEPSNLRSAGIMIAHNISTILGSDVQNWNKYSKYNLPELKMPINGYKQFIKLLRKDVETIETFVEGKYSEEVIIRPSDYPDCDFKLKIYNDINVIFGGKGTGKTELLLKEIKKHFEDKGFSDVSSYFPNDDIKDFDNLKVVNLKESDVIKITKDELEKEFKTLNTHTAITLTPTSGYFNWIKSKLTKQNKFGYLNSTFIDTIEIFKRDYENEYKHYNTTRTAITDLSKVAVTPYLSEGEIDSLQIITKKLEVNSWNKVLKTFIKYESSKLTQWTIERFKSIYQSKTSIISKPSNLGLIKLFENSLEIFESAKLIKNSLSLKPHIEVTVVGNLINKGTISSEIEYSINPNDAKIGTKYLNSSVNKTKLIQYKKSIDEIVDSNLSINQQKSINDFKTNNKGLNINKLSDLLLYNGRIIDEEFKTYEPSPGEKMMLLLNSKLMDDTKNVYILDEPESKVGHKYINDVIIPRLLELAKKDKKIIITTHDANIAVRTLPLLSVYREQVIENDKIKYRTYTGSPFFDDMKCLENSELKKNWVDISIDTLEGGEKAFIERGENYGK